MTITAIIAHCRKCGEELHDPASKARKIGSTCWSRLTRAQKLEMLALAAAEAKPGYIPPTRPASPQARANRADALTAIDQVVECGCGSGALAGRCPECRAEQTDPMGVLAKRVARVIARIRATRTEERDARYYAWLATHQPEPEQLTIGA
jgi:serine/threonine protein kinase HipA of HipAB toxin-antitoxin module